MSAFAKETLRSIRGSLGRFLAIALIVALGTGFYAGLRMTAPDMDLAADAYYDDTDLMDIRVVSTMGLTQADLDALGRIEGVEAVMGAYETDVLATIGDEQYAARVHSLPLDATAREDEQAAQEEAGFADLNRIEVVEGRWPEAVGECVISADRVMGAPTALGDQVVVTEGAGEVDEVLRTRDYTIVGFATSPYYVNSTQMGTTSVGSGTIEQFMYVLADDFVESYPYTEAFLTVEGAKGLEAGSEGYQQLVDEVMARIEAIAPAQEQARLEQLRAEAQRELDEARASFEATRADALRELDDARAELDAAQATLERSEARIESGQADYDRGTAELAEQRASAQARLDEAQAQIDRMQAEADQAAALLPSLRQALQQVQGALAADPDNAGLLAQQAELQARIAAIEAAPSQLAEARAQLAAERERAEAELASAGKRLSAAAAQLASGRSELASGRAAYEDGVAEYEASRAEAEEGFAQAEAELADAQRQVDDIERPEWLVMDRTKNYGAASFEADAERVDHIAQVFPFLFFLVAALVALTTMTRMVEEERVLIGTFKALGYSRARITAKYLAYAGIASAVGAVVGIVALSLILPYVIMEAYSIIYSVPKGLSPINVPLALLAGGLGVGVTLAATWFACGATLREAPAELMLPRAPKAGRRILLERAAPLWRRLSFSWKVTFRNLFRYKKRLVMTVIGIAGCTALLLTGLGLQDSINDIIDKQFGPLVRYDVVVAADPDQPEEARAAVESALSEQGEASGRAQAQVDAMMAERPEGGDIVVSVVVPEDSTAFQELWTLRNRLTGQDLGFGPDSVIVTEKLADALGIEVGDSIELWTQDSMGNAAEPTYSLVVDGIAENYVDNYAIVGAHRYEEAFGEAPSYATTFALVPDDEGVRAALNERLRAIEGVRTVSYNDEVIDAYRTMLRSVNMVVIVLVVAAAALAFVVLYNLTNINITERMREIATLKVLGFTSREVDLYIYREVLMLSVLGALAGLALGVWMEGFVVVTAEVDQVMFGRDIHWQSFAIAFVLTMVFTVVVMVAMRGKLAAIDMVESLKSNE